MQGRRKLAGAVTAMSIAAIAVGIGVQGAAPAFAASPSWVIAQAPQPTGGGGLEGVSCPTVTMCLAVGHQNAGPFTEPDGPLAELWNGTAWTIQPTPSPAGFQYGVFNAVSCSSAAFCMAVGRAYSSPDTNRTFAEAWNGATWTIEPTPTPGAGGHLDSVACTSCTAVGIQLVTIGTNGAWHTLAEHWDGSKWTIQPTPNPGGGDQTTLDAVSCTQTSFCVAAGSDADKSGETQYAFSANWNGTTWTAKTAPYLTGTNGDYLTGITCFTRKDCIAAGNTQTINAQYTTLVDQWNGSSWTTLPSPAVPAGAAYFEIRSSSCANPTACAAVGGYTIPQGGGIIPEGLPAVFIMQTTG
jgi:hypothetical protein